MVLLRWVLYRVGCLSRVLGGVSRTYAHSRRQVRSFAPVLRGIGRRAARGGWSGNWGASTGVLLLPTKRVPAIRGYHITLSGYHLVFKRVPHSIAKAGVLLRLLVLARMWKDWVPHLKGSITAGAVTKAAPTGVPNI